MIAVVRLACIGANLSEEEKSGRSSSTVPLNGNSGGSAVRYVLPVYVLPLEVLDMSAGVMGLPSKTAGPCALEATCGDAEGDMGSLRSSEMGGNRSHSWNKADEYACAGEDVARECRYSSRGEG